MVEVAVDQVTIDAEYSKATKREEDAPKPSACSLGLAFQATEPLEVALRYDSLNDDNKNTINVESRIGGGFNWELFEAVTLSAEYGNAREEENDQDGEKTPGNRNEFFAKLAIEF